MRFVDMHCDTLTALYRDPDKGNLYKNSLCVDFERLKSNGQAIEFFACFICLKSFLSEKNGDKYIYDLDQAYEYANKVLDYFQETTAIKGNLCRMIRSRNDIDVFFHTCTGDTDKQPAGALLTIEEGGILDSSPERLQALFDRGVRLMTLTWNYENCLGYPNSPDAVLNSRGLKPFGFETVRRMEELGMIVDVSHLSDGGFYDVARTLRKPFVASHSNARALCPHPRNLTDDMLKILGEHGGVAGLNFCPDFLDAENGCTLKAMTDHICHIIDTAGEDAAALGTDFDGISGPLAVEHTGQMQLLHQALERSPLSERIIDKVWYENAVRVMKDILPEQRVPLAELSR